MHGNVWEWVRDVYGPYTGEPQTDPTGPDRPASAELAGYAYPEDLFVVKGGSYSDTGLEVRSAVRRSACEVARDFVC